ncbi:GNAT family N-acetyltransferase [Herbaspirillum sp. alder98]|uniref:GNAT family N-acetyltransferase n=1 Tax=Herbaspirillum sp. alder98 TaxID=2913096 RepID=UPI001CD85DEC|nr:GNAT family N-acetyltransferase [Herbaspirillum sp. alder98]MCA1322669.1 GNAT family N-acetyltransferase [Herbaspirillum sp. alder98]
MAYFWREMTAADLPQVMEIAACVHVGYFESEAVFAERLALFAPGCLVAVEEGAESALLGYSIMHPACRGLPPPLNSLLRAIAPHADSLHLHDVAMLPKARGLGLGRALVARMHFLMRHYRLAYATLVAVHGSVPYWQASGFAVADESAEGPWARLASYGDEAIYMILRSEVKT